MLEDLAVWRIADGLLLRCFEIVEDEEFRLLGFIFDSLHVAEMRLLDHLLAETTLILATLVFRLPTHRLTTLASEHLGARGELQPLLLVLVLKEFFIDNLE